MEIIGFEISAPLRKEDVSALGGSRIMYSQPTAIAKITVTVDDYSDMTLDAEIALPDKLLEQIRALIQEHLDNRGKRS